MKKILVVCLTALLLLAMISSGCTEEGSDGKEKKKEELSAQEIIDAGCLENYGTTYYGGWLFTPENVSELRTSIDEAGKIWAELQYKKYRPVTNTEIVDLWLDVWKKGTNWGNLYERNIFDCSEMSAYIECVIEHLGYNAYIVEGIGHAWVLFEANNKTIPVESTGMFIVLEGYKSSKTNRTYENYFSYKYMSSTIYDIYEYSEEHHGGQQYDWWVTIENKGLDSLEIYDQKFNETVQEWIFDWFENLEDLPNQKPVADFYYYPTEIYTGYEITFDASTSYDPDGQIAEIGGYLWNIDGEFVSMEQTFNHTFYETGEYTIELEVIDDKGESDYESMIIMVEEEWEEVEEVQDDTIF